jgi:hypothetical protein
MGENGPVRFLSPEWLDHLSSVTAAASPATTLSVHQRVTGGPDGDVEYTLRVAGGRVTFEPGPGSAAFDVDLTSDYETAVLINRGFLSPAAAFAAGRLRVGGSVSSLVNHQEALADIGRLLAGVSAATTY